MRAIWRGLAMGLAVFTALSGADEAVAGAKGADDGADYAVLDPRGIWPDGERMALTPRPKDLSGKTVYLIRSWDQGGGFDGVFERVAAALKARFPGIDPVIKDRNLRYSEDDPKLWQDTKSEATAFLYAAAPSSSTTSYAIKWSAKLEKMGVPGAAVIFDTLLSPADTTKDREGAPIRYTAVPYPAETMDEAAFAAATERIVATLLEPLTAEEVRTGAIARPEPPRIAARGSLDDIQRFFHENGLSDGLPIVPPTEKRVAAMLKGTSHRPDEVLTRAMAPEGLTVTVEKVAINAVMAGCEPEHMPVLLAMLEAYGAYNFNSVVRSTNSFAFMQVVNGPIRNALKMNGGVYALGPGNRANAAMGRALRLFITNLGGGRPGVNMMGVIGNVATYPFLFAEFEEDSPWEPLSVTLGFKPGENTLTLFSGGWSHSGNYGHVRFNLDHVAADIAQYEIYGGATVIISPKRAELLAAEGLSKDDVRNYLQEKARLTLGELRTSLFFRDTPETAKKPDAEAIPVFAPGSIHVVVAGGDASPMMQAWSMYRPIAVSIDKWK